MSDNREELDPLVRWDLERRESAKVRRDERRAELAGRMLEQPSDVGDEDLDVEAFLDAIAWAIEDDLAEQGRSAVDVDALRVLVTRDEVPSREELRAVLLVDVDEVAELMDPVRGQWAEGKTPEYAAALWNVSASDVLVRLVARALEA